MILMKYHALLLRKSGKISQNLSSAAVVIGALSVSMLFCHLLNFFQNYFFKGSFRNTIMVFNSLDQDQNSLSGLIWVQNHSLHTT